METVEEKLRERGATTPERRSAHFVSALCVAWPDGHTEEFEGRVTGTLVWPPRGDKGFGYDPIFYARRPCPHLRRDAERGEARLAAARQRSARIGRKARSSSSRRRVLIAVICPACSRDGDDPQFGVYVHWPFCLSKCPYCDFNSHVRRAAIDEQRFVRAFAAEIATTAARVPGRTVSTIFFGGGTPSLMQPATVGAILDAIAQHWTVAPDAEVTLEANPTSVEAARFRGYRSAGINRVSLGVQALDDRVLAELGRLHSAREAIEAVHIARSAFERTSFDLIYARPQQTPREWAKSN